MRHSPVILSTKTKLRVPPGVLWSFLANTDQLNRAVGLPAINFRRDPDPKKKGHYIAETRFLGFRLAYEEFPFDWVEGQYHQVRRRFASGPIEEIVTGVRLLPLDGETELEVFARVTPRSWIGSLLSDTVLRRMTSRGIIALSHEFEKQYVKEQSTPQVVPPSSPANTTQLESRIRQLRKFPISEPLVQKLKDHIETASDLDVVSMRPFEIASRWSGDRSESLKLFLYACKAGLLDLHWTILCPNCRAASLDTMTLAQLKSESHCETCEIHFGTDLGSSVEARFSVNPAVRIARREIYCIGGPANKPHIVTQLRLEPGERRTEELQVSPGVLRVHSFQTEGIEKIRVSEGDGVPGQVIIQITPGHLHVSDSRWRAGNVGLSVTNSLKEEALVIIDSETWHENAATAALVTSLQDFKDLFPEEAVAPGQDIGISSITIMFTDLSDSTALYRRIGDSKAFSFVQNHFRYLTESVSKHHGGVVKTMGDAIMASFWNGLDALQAAVEMHRQWNEFCARYGNHRDIRLKIGMHHGPAIATNNKGKFDCFGATINIASRLEKLSAGGDVIISDALKLDSEIARFLSNTSHELTAETFSVNLKGFDEQLFTLWRVRLRPTRET